MTEQNQPVEVLVDSLIRQVKIKIAEAPEFRMPEVNQVTPTKLAECVIGCSRTIEALADVHAEIPVIRTQLRELRSELVRASRSFNDEVFDNAHSFLRDYDMSLEIRQKALSSNLNALRGLLSQISKNAAVFGAQVLEAE